MITPIQERAIHCMRRLILGICNEPHRCVVHVDRDGDWPKVAAEPCAGDYAILHGQGGRQTKAFMSMAQRLGLQYSLVDGHGVEARPEGGSSYLKQKVSTDDALELFREIAFLLFGHTVNFFLKASSNGNTTIGYNGKTELKLWMQINHSNRDEAAIVSLLADIFYPYSWNQLDAVIKVRPSARRKANV